MSSGILADRDTNGPISRPADEATTIKPTDMRRQSMRSPMKENGVNGAKKTYISPSDNIMSPASQKLSQFRSKNYMNKARPKMLFTRSNLSNNDTVDTDADMSNAFPNVGERESVDDKAVKHENDDAEAK